MSIYTLSGRNKSVSSAEIRTSVIQKVKPYLSHCDVFQYASFVYIIFKWLKLIV